MLLRITVHEDEICRQFGYVYAALVPDRQLVYIGQTRAFNGALGRLSQHLVFSPPGTLRARAADILGENPNGLGSVEFAAVRLSNRRMFHSDARDYREAVEALCQYSMIESVTQAEFSVGFISRVTINGYAKDPNVIAEAERVATKLFDWLESTVSTRSTQVSI